MYCLWRPPTVDAERWSHRLRTLAEALSRTSAVRFVQVNIDDADVGSAMVRMATFDQPISGFCSVWFDTATGEPRRRVEARLAEQCTEIAGYLVTESVPLAPPEPPAGARADGFANVAVLRRPDELDPITWLERWQGGHTEIAITTQSTVGYVQNVVVRPVTDDAPTVHGIVEELFPIEALTDFHVFFDTGGDDAELARRLEAMTASVATFSGSDAVLDVVPTSRYGFGAPGD